MNELYKALVEITSEKDLRKNNLTLSDFNELRYILQHFAKGCSKVGFIQNNVYTFIKKNTSLKLREINGFYEVELK